MSRLAMCLLGITMGVACRPTTTDESPAPWFTDITAAAGVDFTHAPGARGRFLLPEIMGGGGGLFDYDGDGLLDIYVVQSDAAAGGNRLYRNTGQGRFADVTARADVGDHGYGMGCAVGDADNDGDVDLYVTNLGANTLYLNNGDGTFRDVTATAGVGGDAWSTSAAWCDVDHDGWLDIVVVNYVAWQDTPAFVDKRCYGKGGARDYCSPQAYAAPAADHLYRNNGDGTFSDISVASGFGAKAGTGLGVVCTDLDGDGLIDIYVANDQMPSFAWINRGAARFEERAVALGCAVDEMGKSQAGMGVDAVDINDDGAMDLWKVHLFRETHVLYINRNDFFDDATTRWGLSAATRRFTGFGTAVFDADLDGLRDIVVANGRVQHVADAFDKDNVYAEPNQLLVQSTPGRFSEARARGGPALAAIHNSRAAAFGDIDNDGDIDALIVNCGGPARLLRNDAPRRGHYLTIRAVDRHGRDAIGARLTLRFGTSTRVAEVRSAYSYCAANDLRVHVGVGDVGTVDTITVRWPDGTQSTGGPYKTNTTLTLTQPGPPPPPTQ